MIDYLFSHLWQLWAIIAVVCLILELSSGDFFIICFSIGAVFATIAAAIGLNVYWQLGLFALFSLISIFTVRPIALRCLHKNDPNRASNADALIGRKGRVTASIPAGGSGYVQIDGDLWKAVSKEPTEIDTGSTVLVIDRKSTIITVEEL